MENRIKEKEKSIKSMKEIEEEFFPESSKKKALETRTDPQTLGVNLAKESLENIKSKLSKK